MVLGRGPMFIRTQGEALRRTDNRRALKGCRTGTVCKVFPVWASYTHRVVCRASREVVPMICLATAFDPTQDGPTGFCNRIVMA
jgi:hypothetical protein